MMTALLTAGLALSCTRPLEEGQPSEERGNLTLRLSPGLLSTKAGSLATGDTFRNVLVIMANDANRVVQRIYKELDSGVASDVVSFQDLKVGTYQVYAYANIDHTAWQNDPFIADEEKMLAQNQDGGGLLNVDRELKTFYGTETPPTPDESMLLTGHKVLSVGSYENIGEIELLRPVSRFNVYVHNHTDYVVTLKSLDFSDFNPSRGYLLSHWDDSGEPLFPAGTEYRSLPSYDSEHPLVLSASSGRTLAYSHYLWEGSAPEDYRMFARIKIDFGNGSFTEKGLSQNWVYPLHYADVYNMAVGETKEVMLLNPNTNNGAFYGHNGSQVQKTLAQYSTNAQYEAAARAILSDNLKRESYILTLTRTADGVKIHRGNWNVCYGNGKDFAYLEQGTPTAGTYPISAFTAEDLFQFRTDAWNHWDFIWNNGTAPGYHNAESREKAQEGNYMWALYEVKGSNLRLIDNSTAQVTPLRQMLRNQELNVVLNVYYQQEARAVSFEIDNTYWTEGHTESHTYN